MVNRAQGLRGHAQRDEQGTMVGQVAAEDDEERDVLHSGRQQEPVFLPRGHWWLIMGYHGGFAASYMGHKDAILC